MHYMVCYTLKDTATPSEQAALVRKFQSWQPPNGLTMEAKDFDRNKVTNFIEGVARSSTRHGSRLGSAQSGPFATW